MRIRYDAEVDALSISFRDTTVTTQEWAEGIAGEYDANGQLVGIESVNRAGDHMFGRRLLAAHGSITPEQAADSSFDLKSALT